MSAAAKSPNGRDAFAEAREAFMLDVLRRSDGDGAARVGFALAIGFASRREFEKTGRLVAWPSIRTIMSYIGMFKGKVERGIKSLEATGHLVVERPEKRGATHHNRYVLRVPNVLTDGDNSEGVNVPANVDNSEGANVPTDGDINVPMDGDTMSPPAGTNLLENPPEGVGALTRPSPDAPDGGEVCDVDEHDQDANAATSAGARERARSTCGGSLADRALEAQRLVPASAPDADPDPAALHFKDGADVSLVEFDRLHAQAREALARHEAAQALGGALGLDDFGGDCAAGEVINGLLGHDDEDKAKIAARTLRVISMAAPASRRPVWDGIRRAVRGVVAAYGHGAGAGDVAEDALVAAINLATANRSASVEKTKIEAEVEK